MRRRFITLDVFTADRFAGNPLAVVLDADGLDTAAMQGIAREFNLSETVFVLPAEDSRHRARLRIFTPGRELPFAGHPTVGTAALLALRHGDGGADAQMFGLEEPIGIVPCVVETRGADKAYARFRLPVLPEAIEGGPDSAAVAWALGLDPAQIGFDRHVPSRHSAGNPFTFVPVNSVEALGRAAPAPDAFGQVFADGAGVYVYARSAEPGQDYRARMFGSPALGVREDPATGSAAAAFAGVLMQCEPLGDGEHSVTIGQGHEMGRPSTIDLQIVIREGALASAEIGGGAVMVSEGEIEA
jgi:trans-2,3-dihydro-3-hydroxyanthranilate isomerase